MKRESIELDGSKVTLYGQDRTLLVKWSRQVQRGRSLKRDSRPSTLDLTFLPYGRIVRSR